MYESSVWFKNHWLCSRNKHIYIRSRVYKKLRESPARGWRRQEAGITQFLTHKFTLLSRVQTAFIARRSNQRPFRVRPSSIAGGRARSSTLCLLPFLWNSSRSRLRWALWRISSRTTLRSRSAFSVTSLKHLKSHGIWRNKDRWRYESKRIKRT